MSGAPPRLAHLLLRRWTSLAVVVVLSWCGLSTLRPLAFAGSRACGSFRVFGWAAVAEPRSSAGARVARPAAAAAGDVGQAEEEEDDDFDLDNDPQFQKISRDMEYIWRLKHGDTDSIDFGDFMLMGQEQYRPVLGAQDWNEVQNLLYAISEKKDEQIDINEALPVIAAYCYRKLYDKE
mmetsp:Transcript_21447/g.54778  ORF Transcript_21447/g.54778 Transcript_21447/m.54778 type:complete len:179 (-) Transcript_21447:60-596(-)